MCFVLHWPVVAQHPVTERWNYLMEDKAVEYEVLRDYGDKDRVLQDVIVSDDVCTREKLERLGCQLSRQFKDKLVVAVVIRRRRTSTSLSDREGICGGEADVDRWHARYVRSPEIGLHKLVIYPHDAQAVPEVIRYS